jgi:16S rRNA (uracil1498-N3)-methyltransferase
MREPRVYTSQDLESGKEITLEAGSAHHLLKVLRLSKDARLRLFNGDGREYGARLTLASKEAVLVDILEMTAEEAPPPLPLKLYLGISKGERMDFAIQKAVELGVSGIHPMFCARSVVQLKGERLQRRMEHWRGVLIGACEQSGRCLLPNLVEPSDFPTALTQTDKADCRLVLHHRAARSLDELPSPKRGVDLLIGPEGGLESAELELAIGLGFSPLRLGPRVLRTETAPLAALAAIQMLWGDFKSSLTSS